MHMLAHAEVNREGNKWQEVSMGRIVPSDVEMMTCPPHKGVRTGDFASLLEDVLVQGCKCFQHQVCAYVSNVRGSETHTCACIHT